MSKTLMLKPKLSEKTYALSDKRVYVVEIDKKTNKHAVARAVKQQFEVEVQSVRILNTKGKAKQVRNLAGTKFRNAKGKRSDSKKAYVTLKVGYNLPFFAVVEEEEAKTLETQKQFDKALAKEAAKSDKPKLKRLGRITKKAKVDEEKN